MSDPTDLIDANPALRGEAAWLKHCQDIADRNAAASRAGKAKRDEIERDRERRRRSAEAAEAARLSDTGI